MEKVSDVNFAKGNGLLPVIAQDHETGEVLMLAYMNQLAWEKTLETGKVHYWSRSREKLWLKGETSGHVQLLKEAYVDCDLDTILVRVEQLGGAACHTGFRSCFFRKVQGGDLVPQGTPVFDPHEIYGSQEK
jgi:phosphoribosyl-AMP cyclohydrolase